jgi:hypothetical protein
MHCPPDQEITLLKTFTLTLAALLSVFNVAAADALRVAVGSIFYA